MPRLGKRRWSVDDFRAARVLAWDRPPRYGMQGRLPFTVGRGPVPRHASVCTENGVGWRSVFAQIERSRGTGPRATGQGGVLLAMPRSGAGAPELQSLGHANDRGGQPPRYELIVEIVEIV